MPILYSELTTLKTPKEQISVDFVNIFSKTSGNDWKDPAHQVLQSSLSMLNSRRTPEETLRMIMKLLICPELEMYGEHLNIIFKFYDTKRKTSTEIRVIRMFFVHHSKRCTYLNALFDVAMQLRKSTR